TIGCCSFCIFLTGTITCLLAASSFSFEDGLLVSITQVTAPVVRRRRARPIPYHLLRVCNVLWMPFHTFSDGNIRYWSAFCFRNRSKSLLLKLLSITSQQLRVLLNLSLANSSKPIIFMFWFL